MARPASGSADGMPEAQPISPPPAPQVVVMGVSGSGKTTVGHRLAGMLHLPYVDGDDLHPPENVARMAAGIPLDDACRAGWLDQVAECLAAAAQDGVVVSCSALKRSYRDRLREAAPHLHLVFLHGDASLIGHRMSARAGHYMPASLLQSQLDTLEPPSAQERPLCADVTQAPDAIAAHLACTIRQAVAT
jgi:gluconokinase